MTSRFRVMMLAFPAGWLWGLMMLMRGRDRVRSADPELLARYNWSDGIFPDVLRLTMEVLVLYAILRPHSYSRSWRRALCALAVILPWLFVNFVMGQHAGPMFNAHFFWIVFATAGVVALAVWSFVASRFK